MRPRWPARPTRSSAGPPADTTLSKAMSWFSRAAGVAERHGLSLWRARALHELATVSLLRDLSLNDLHQARQAALDAGAAGLLASVDFHIAAIHGVRFEADLALAAGRRCLAEARRIGVVRQQAWGWILIGQANAVRGTDSRPLRQPTKRCGSRRAMRRSPGSPPAPTEVADAVRVAARHGLEKRGASPRHEAPGLRGSMWAPTIDGHFGRTQGRHHG